MSARDILSTALEGIVNIEKEIKGQERKEYWENKLDIFKNEPNSFVGTQKVLNENEKGVAIHLYLCDKNLMVIAEENEEFCGFMFGHIKEGEYGSDTVSGWIEILGVTPKEQGKGTGAQIADAFIAQLKKMGINTVYTLINWKDTNLASYFATQGFQRSEFLTLKKDI